LNVQELLEKGLYHYGLGETDKAIELWNEVLAMDPGNETAREYIEIETGRKVEAAEPAADEVVEFPEAVEADVIPAGRPLAPEFAKGQQYLQKEEWEQAANSFEAAHKKDPANPTYWAYVDLARSRVIKAVVDELGNGKLPRLTVPLTELAGRKRFTQEEGFVLSLVNGEMTLEDIVALSPIPRYQSYRIISQLLSEDLIEA